MKRCDVFVSYKREDADLVEPIVRKLRTFGLDVWLDTRLHAGSAFDQQIADRLASARCVLVCWTPQAISSEWVRSEATSANNEQKLVACFLKPTTLIAPFNIVQTENLAGWFGEDDHAGWAKVLTRIAALSDNAELSDWAQLMADGEPKVLREWARKQPASSLRLTTYFWISELDGVRVSIPDAQSSDKRRRTLRTRWRRLAIWQKIAVILVGGIFASMPVGAGLWMQANPELSSYDVEFDGPVVVTSGSNVRFNGIPVGRVATVKMDRRDANKILARIEVRRETPIRTSSEAVQAVDPASGIPYIQILGGDFTSPFVTRGEFETAPRIRSRETSADFLVAQNRAALEAELVLFQREYYRLMLDKLSQHPEAGGGVAKEEVAAQPAGADAERQTVPVGTDDASETLATSP